jgi:RNA polymerase sigma-70 factor (ECF subfamily)
MLALRAGDDEAFNALFERWSGALLRYLERMVTSRAQAEELMQETFLRVYRARERYEVRARFSTWLYTIATRIALNEMRRPGHRSLDAGPQEAEYTQVDRAADQPAIDDVVDARLRGKQVESALRALPERQRAALWLASVEGMSYAEVADALEVSAQSVKALVHRARSAVSKRTREGTEA